MKCPNCGNDDATRMLTITRPIVVDRKIVAQEIAGHECMSCGQRQPHPNPIGKPADASTSGAA